MEVDEEPTAEDQVAVDRGRQAIGCDGALGATDGVRDRRRAGQFAGARTGTRPMAVLAAAGS